jgi:polysaccharide biosynthesis/export protein
MSMRGGARGSLLGVAFVLALACAGRQPAAPPVMPGPFDREEYVIGASDELGISVWKNPELTLKVPVRPDGKISVPLLDDVQAAGLTPQELKEVLTEKLSEYVTAPDVTVVVEQVNSKRIYVVGEVLRPSAVPLTQDLRALDAIAMVGGFNTFADRSGIKILRPSPDGSVTEYRFDYKAFLKGKQPEANLLLRPGDTIVVPD